MRFDVMPVATEKQIEELEAAAAVAWQECYAGMYPEGQYNDLFRELQSKEAMRRFMREGYIYYMVLVDNQFAGYLSFRHHGNRVFLYSLYVKPDFRQMGIGRKIVEQFDRMLSGEEFLHVNKLTLRIPRTNDQTVNILKRLDFQVTREIDNHIVKGYPLNEYIMERKVKRSPVDHGQ